MLGKCSAEFRKLCQPMPEELGLPRLAKAWREANEHASQSAHHGWSHRAVYLAGREAGWHELMIKTASWQRDINAGYRKTVVAPEHRTTRDERLGNDGIRKGDLRERMQPELFAILTIRYDDNQANRINAWQRIQHQIRGDQRLPKPLRCNPVLLRLWLMYELQHNYLREKKGRVGLEIKGRSERTVFRWKKACHTVCDEWINQAEDEAQHLLEQAGVIHFEY